MVTDDTEMKGTLASLWTEPVENQGTFFLCVLLSLMCDMVYCSTSFDESRHCHYCEGEELHCQADVRDTGV